MSQFSTKSAAVLALFAVLGLGAQQQDSVPVGPESRGEAYGIRLGADLSRLLITALDDNYEGFELVGDYRISRKLFLAGELGNESRNVEEILDNENAVNIQSLYDYTSSGSYLKAGIDYNTYQNWYGMNNSIVVGFRYAFSTFSTDLNRYSYFNTNRYWNPEGFPQVSDTAVELGGLNASWVEMLLGVKTELFANIFLGASIRLGMLISRKESEIMPHLWIPGFNRVTDDSAFGVGFNYSISYFLPLYRKARPVPESEGEQP